MFSNKYRSRSNAGVQRSAGLEAHFIQAFQTAVALACFEAKGDGDRIPELQDDHIREVVNMSRKFKDYLKGLHGDEVEVTYHTGIRNAGFVPSVGN